jgi:outer membrane protein TolC
MLSIILFKEGNLMAKKLFPALLLIFSAFSASLFAGDLTWDLCVNEALKNSLSLISAREILNQARAASWMPVSSALPQISASASGSKSGNEPGVDATPTILNGISYNPANTYDENYSYGLTAKQLIFDGFDNTQQILKASEDLKAAELNYKIASSQVRYNLKQSYANLMKAQRMVVITGQIYDLRTKQYGDLKLRYGAGTENKGDLMYSEADMEQAKFEQDQAVRDLELAKLDFGNKLGRDKTDDIVLKEDFTTTENSDKDPDFDALMKTNYSQLLAAAQVRSAGYALGSTISSMLPTAYLDGSLGRGGSELMPQNTQWSFGVDISFSIFDGGKSAAQTAQASAALSQAKADEKSSDQQALYTLENSWNAFKDAVLTLAVQNNYLIADQERAKIADAQYTTGLIVFNDWTIIQDSLVSAQKSFVAAQAQLLISEAAWVQAKGGTLEDDIR